MSGRATSVPLCETHLPVRSCPLRPSQVTEAPSALPLQAAIAAGDGWRIRSCGALAPAAGGSIANAALEKTMAAKAPAMEKV